MVHARREQPTATLLGEDAIPLRMIKMPVDTNYKTRRFLKRRHNPLPNLVDARAKAEIGIDAAVGFFMRRCSPARICENENTRPTCFGLHQLVLIANARLVH
jgi:hypothetical protein